MLSIVSIISIFLFFIISCAKNKAPSSPTGINAEVRYTYIHVSWDAVPNADYYIINYKGLLEKAYGTSFDDYNPKNGYNEYRVAAVNDYGKVLIFLLTAIIQGMVEEAVAVVEAPRLPHLLQQEFLLL